MEADASPRGSHHLVQPQHGAIELQALVPDEPLHLELLVFLTEPGNRVLYLPGGNVLGAKVAEQGPHLLRHAGDDLARLALGTSSATSPDGTSNCPVECF